MYVHVNAKVSVLIDFKQDALTNAPHKLCYRSF